MNGALAEASDPQTLPGRLAELAKEAPETWSLILGNPNCYPGLREWIQQQMAVSAAVDPPQDSPSSQTSTEPASGPEKLKMTPAGESGPVSYKGGDGFATNDEAAVPGVSLQTEAASMQRPDKDVHVSKAKLIAIGVVAIVVLGIVGVGVGYSIARSSEDAGNQEQLAEIGTENKASDQDTTPTVEKELSFEQQVDALKIEAGLSPEEFAHVFFERQESWILAGKEQYFEEWSAEEDSSIRQGTEIQHRIAEEQKLIYANALFIPGWQNSLSNLAEAHREANEIMLFTWLKSVDRDGSWGTPEWKEERIVERVELIEEDPILGTRTLLVSGYEANNGAETRNADSPNVKHNGKPWSFYITTTVVDGTEYISDWAIAK